MTAPRFVLASASPARRSTLIAAGLEPEVITSEVDEPAVLDAYNAQNPPADAATAVLVLAQAKARAVANSLQATVALAEPTLVVGCDSMLELGGEIHGKPRDAAHARERLRSMSGQWGTLHSGHWVMELHNGKVREIGQVASPRVKIATLSNREIEAYVATQEPLFVAGSFTIDGLGGWFVEGVEGDPHAVVGLSLPLMRNLLLELGYTPSQWWR